MDVSSQAKLVDIPEQPDHHKPPAKGQPKLTEVNRQQTMMAMIYVEELIGPDHKARAIWQLVERFDLIKALQRIVAHGQRLCRTTGLEPAVARQRVGICL